MSRGKRIYVRVMQRRNLFLWAFFVFASLAGHGQDTQYHPPPRIIIDSSEKTNAAKSLPYYNSRDLVDVIRKMQHKEPVSGSNISSYHLSVVPAAGYSLQTGLAAVLSGNLGFYTGSGNHADEKISSILSSVTYSQYRQIIFPLQADIWTRGGKYNIIVDWRYLAYPSTTFGLGGHSDLNDGYTINFNYIKLHQTILRKLRQDLYGGIGLYYDYAWNIKQVNPPADVVTDFQRYGLTKTVTAVGPAFRLVYDNRENQINSTNGWYGNFVYRPNFTFMGSDNDWQSLLLELRKYIPLSSSKRNVLAIWSYNWLTLGSGKPPYLLLPSTGWDDFYNTGRGYIQGRYRGRDMLYLETEYRFNLSQNGLFGGVIFANAQSFSKELSKQLSYVAPGAGVGLRIKLNKFSGANLCIDYGFGIQGSKGLSVNLGEVF